jgi:hypothetical protein
MNEGQSPAAERPSWRFVVLLIAIGLVSVASMLLASLEALVPEGIEIPPALLLVQPAILVIGLALAGWWAAPKIGLGAPVLAGLVDGGDWLGALRRALPGALGGGVLGAAILLVYAYVTAGAFGERAEAVALPMVTRVLYGGVAEEIMMRWGLLSLLALAALKLGLARGGALWVGNLAAALVFALGHFPALFALMPDPSGGLLAAVLLANTGAGLVFGWLYMHRGLEAAIVAHALTHLIAVPLATLML